MPEDPGRGDTVGKKVLITGGAGFIGSHLALRLLEKGQEITILDNLSPQIHGDAESSPTYRAVKEKTRFIRGDVRNREDWILALKDQDQVVHLAAETGTGQSMYQVEHYTSVNIGGTAILLDLLANGQCQAEKLVVASSRAVYGEGKYKCEEHGIMYPESRKEEDLFRGDFGVKCSLCSQDVSPLQIDESSKLNPSSIYAITKLAQEQMALTTGRALGVPTVAFRYQNVYGPGQSLVNPYTGILSIFSTQMKCSQPVNVFEDGQQSRDFVYIDDVVEATIQGLEKHEADYQVFNVGTGEKTTVLTVAQALKQLYQVDMDIKITGRYRAGDIRHNVADLSKIRDILGFESRYDFQKGISAFCSWVENQPITGSRYQQTMQEMKIRGLYK